MASISENSKIPMRWIKGDVGATHFSNIWCTLMIYPVILL